MSSLAPRPQPILLARGEAVDLDDVMTVMRAAFSPDFGEAWTRSQCAGILPMSGVAMILARDPATHEPLGFSLLRTVADEAELLLVAVVPPARERGIGAALVDHFVTYSRGWGATRLLLEVRDANTALALYQRSGFEIAGRRHNYYQGPGGVQYDALTLVLQSPQD